MSSKPCKPPSSARRGSVARSGLPSTCSGVRYGGLVRIMSQGPSVQQSKSPSTSSTRSSSPNAARFLRAKSSASGERSEPVIDTRACVGQQRKRKRDGAAASAQIQHANALAAPETRDD